MFHFSIKKSKKASATIEAAIILPILVTLLLIFIYLFFFHYNRCVVTRAAYCSALRASQLEYATAKEQKEAAEKALTELIHHKLIGIKQYEKKVSVKNKQVKVSIKIEQKIPFSMLVKPLIGSQEIPFTVEKTATCICPYQNIRLIRIGEHHE